MYTITNKIDETFSNVTIKTARSYQEAIRVLEQMKAIFGGSWVILENRKTARSSSKETNTKNIWERNYCR